MGRRINPGFQNVPFKFNLAPLRRGDAHELSKDFDRRSVKGGAEVGLRTSRMQLTHKLESAWFQPLMNLKRDFLVSKFAFSDAPCTDRYAKGLRAYALFLLDVSGANKVGLYTLNVVDP
jgi:hypothetical protein